MSDFPALPGLYKLLFLYVEPVSTMLPALMAWGFPGATWFHHELLPSIGPTSRPVALDARTTLAIWQLGSCYMLLGLISSLVFRAARDALPQDLRAQERVTGALLTALALADSAIRLVVSIVVSFAGLPDNIRWNPVVWNPMTHGNITSVILLFVARSVWFLGYGRRRYWYGQRSSPKAGKTS